MADIANWDAYMRGRWTWTGFRYEDAFPRKIGFSDIDAVVEMDGRFLFIETKHYEGVGLIPQIPRGQELMLKRLAKLPGVRVIVLYGDATLNLPCAAHEYRWVDQMLAVDFYDWRSDPVGVGRLAFFALLCKFANDNTPREERTA